MHNESFNRSKVTLLNIISFLLGFLGAFLIYILSSYFAKISGNDAVCAFYFVSYVVVLFLLFYLQRLIRTIGKSRTLYLFLGIIILTSALLARLDVSWISV